MAGVRWLDEREERAWRTLKVMHDRLTAALSRELAAGSPLSYPDYEVLVTLTDQPDGRLRPFELAEALGWEQSRLSHHVRRMVARDLVVKVPCETDHRGAFVAVTPAGRRAIEQAAPGHVAAVRRLLIDQLSPKQLDAITEAAEQVLRALAREEPPPSD
jgi:DNA-binding MarR family transcriptional regulator